MLEGDDDEELVSLRAQGQQDTHARTTVPTALQYVPKWVRFDNAPIEATGVAFGRLFFSKHNGVHINLWVYERTAGFTIQELSHQTTRLEDEILFPISNCEYEDDTFPCPNKLESWVERCYGKEWRSKMQVLPGNAV